MTGHLLGGRRRGRAIAPPLGALGAGAGLEGEERDDRREDGSCWLSHRTRLGLRVDRSGRGWLVTLSESSGAGPERSSGHVLVAVDITVRPRSGRSAVKRVVWVAGSRDCAPRMALRGRRSF